MFLVAAAHKSTAHELQPTISDVFVAEDGALTFEFRINLEAFLAGVDLDAVANTDEDTASDAYDALRALPAMDIAARVGEIISAWNAYPLATSAGPIVLTLSSVKIPDDVNFELPRISELRISGPLPEDSDTITVNWPRGAGPLVLRQQGVDEPYTGFMMGGGSSPKIVLSGN